MVRGRRKRTKIWMVNSVVLVVYCRISRSSPDLKHRFKRERSECIITEQGDLPYNDLNYPMESDMLELYNRLYVHRRSGKSNYEEHLRMNKGRR